MTPEERAREVYRDATGPIRVTRYACDSLEAKIAEAIRAAVLAEREACAGVADALSMHYMGRLIATHIREREGAP